MEINVDTCDQVLPAPRRSHAGTPQLHEPQNALHETLQHVKIIMGNAGTVAGYHQQVCFVLQGACCRTRRRNADIITGNVAKYQQAGCTLYSGVRHQTAGSPGRRQ